MAQQLALLGRTVGLVGYLRRWWVTGTAVGSWVWGDGTSTAGHGSWAQHGGGAIPYREPQPCQGPRRNSSWWARRPREAQGPRSAATPLAVQSLGPLEWAATICCFLLLLGTCAIGVACLCGSLLGAEATTVLWAWFTRGARLIRTAVWTCPKESYQTHSMRSQGRGAGSANSVAKTSDNRLPDYVSRLPPLRGGSGSGGKCHRAPPSSRTQTSLRKGPTAGPQSLKERRRARPWSERMERDPVPHAGTKRPWQRESSGERREQERRMGKLPRCSAASGLRGCAAPGRACASSRRPRAEGSAAMLARAPPFQHPRPGVAFKYYIGFPHPRRQRR